MSRHLLSAAVIGCLFGAAWPTTGVAVNLNPRGIGQALIYPYYTVNGGNQTILSVVNTTSQGKALKIRFAEGRNGRDVLNFNVYLGGHDVWTAAVFPLGDSGPANLATSDFSCTVPTIRNNTGLPQVPGNGPRYVAFRNFGYVGPNDDAGPNDLARTREGFIEIIEMGTLVENSRSARAVEWPLGGAITGEPADCPGLNAAWAPPVGYWSQSNLADIGPPSGGLFGAAALVDVSNGTMVAYSADALDGFRTTAMHREPGVSRPALGDALSDADNDIATAFVNANGSILRSDFRASTHAVDAVSAVFMAESLWNEFSVEPVVAGQSEWLISLPTKRYYTDPALIGGGPAIAPFLERFAGTGLSCSAVAATMHNRNMDTTIDFPEPPPGAFRNLCYQTNVIDFSRNASTNGPSPILGATLKHPYEGAFDTGWVHLDLSGGGLQPQTMRAALDGDIYRGLPLTGFWAVNYVNGNAQPGLLANYGASTAHKTQTSCSNSSGPCS